MGRIHNFLGLSVGVIVPNLGEVQRREAYNADITYATNNELGFDYLRDNMKHERSQMVQRPFNFGIVDEVDSILIDEARTPLIISGPTEDKAEGGHGTQNRHQQRRQGPRQLVPEARSEEHTSELQSLMRNSYAV